MSYKFLIKYLFTGSKYISYVYVFLKSQLLSVFVRDIFVQMQLCS